MLLSDMHVSIPTPTLFCDNISAMSLATNHVFHARTKHIEVDYHFVREKVVARLIDLQYISTIYQLADIFTKAFSGPRFSLLSDKLMVKNSPINLRGNDKSKEDSSDVEDKSQLSLTIFSNNNIGTWENKVCCREGRPYV
ncbi:hypothetical protein U1Q18_052643 [Sarracenia purpurea var. burkii]